MLEQSKQDRKHRERLEKRSISEGRADVCSALNKLAGQDAVQRLAVDVLTALRAAAQGRKRTTGDRNARHDAHLAKGAFNRLHPGSPLARRVPASPNSDFPASEQDDARHEHIGPDLRDHVVVGDAGGGMDANARTRADLAPESMTVEQMRVMAAVKEMQGRYW